MIRDGVQNFLFEKGDVSEPEAHGLGLMAPLLWTSADAGCCCSARVSLDIRLPSYKAEPIFGDMPISRSRAYRDPVRMSVHVQTFAPNPAELVCWNRENSQRFAEWVARCETATLKYFEDKGWRLLEHTRETR